MDSLIIKLLIFIFLVQSFSHLDITAQDLQQRDITIKEKILLNTINRSDSICFSNIEKISLHSLANIFHSLHMAGGYLNDDKKDIQIYLVLNSGIYRYDYQDNLLQLYTQGNYKQQFGRKEMDMAILYITSIKNTRKEKELLYLETCTISNILYKAVKLEKFAVVARKSVDKTILQRQIGLDHSLEISMSMILEKIK